MSLPQSTHYPHIHTHTHTTPPPHTQEILESITIKNLDTGEVMPLSAAEDRIPRGNQWNPLSEHLIRRSNE